MAFLDSADMLVRVKNRLNRPSTDAAFTRSATDDVLYEMGSEAQMRVNQLLAIYAPDAMWTVPTALTSSDSGYTYGFGNDTDGAAIVALGHFRLYEARTHIPDRPMVAGTDYTVEGSVIRMPNYSPRTFSDGGPWAQYVAPSNVIAAATQPTIPKIARLAMVEDWARRAAERLGLDGSGYEAAFQAAWASVLAAIRTQTDQKGRQFGPMQSLSTIDVLTRGR